MIANLADLDAFVERAVIEPFDHRSLQDEVEAFRHAVPTTENLCLEIYRRLRAFPKDRLVRVRVEDAGAVREGAKVPDERLSPERGSRREWRHVQRGVRRNGGGEGHRIFQLVRAPSAALFREGARGLSAGQARAGPQ